MGGGEKVKYSEYFRTTVPVLERFLAGFHQVK